MEQRHSYATYGLSTDDVAPPSYYQATMEDEQAVQMSRTRDTSQLVDNTWVMTSYVI